MGDGKITARIEQLDMDCFNIDDLMEQRMSKILVVDDEPMNVEILEDQLSMANYDVVTAYGGIEALEKVESEKPDLILLDVLMPDLTGFDICRILKEKEKTRFIPIVMVTALSELEDKIKAIESGADDFLTKPVISLELLTRVKSLIRMKYLYDETIERQILQIKAEKELFQRDLKMSQDIQQKFLPDVCPNIEGIELAALTLPAGEVRTNFYDFIPVSRNKLGLVVAHFSGSGILGVLFMALSRVLIRANAVSYPTVSDAIYQANDLIVNDKLLDTGSGISGSLFYALIDLKERNITYIKDEARESIEVDGPISNIIALSANGTQFEVSNALNIEESCITLSTGDTVLLYTDGAVKVLNRNQEEFGIGRMMSVLEKNQDSSAHDLIQKVKEELLLFVKDMPILEDITLIALSDKGAEQISLDTKEVSDYITLLENIKLAI